MYNKNSLRTLTRFHGALFDLEILEVFTTAFLLKTIIWTWIFFKYSRVLSWKTTTKKIFSKKIQATYNLFDLARDRRKTLKREKKWKIRKSQIAIINIYYIYTFTFLYRKIYLLSEKLSLEKLSLYCYICITVFFV